VPPGEHGDRAEVDIELVARERLAERGLVGSGAARSGAISRK
jgi:hypothetical protein